MNEKLLKKFNEIEATHWWWRGRRTLIAKMLGRSVGPILDVGCGTGETLLFLSKKFDQELLYGVDASGLAVKFAKGRGVKNVQVADAKKLPFKNDYFESVLFLDVLEHIKDDVQTLKEAKRVLSLGGRIVVTSPALKFIWSDHDVNQGHFRRYSVHEMEELAKKIGMKLEAVNYFNFFLSPFIILIRLFGKTELGREIVGYDNYINYNIANNKLANNLLTTLFWVDVNLASVAPLPFGISVVAVFSKK